ncbi:hypothetical protein D9619_011246 [Psilocybe cf. subviscida]|uniref:Uncharacterized protein n=1 Tax=Psilocybe cf. subviscida TaxID=2480587 RepID=A0A8H5F568_9AGAR|nr:hypothetical protein D9619_011246 [Psilocybe cf. subviscida]
MPAVCPPAMLTSAGLLIFSPRPTPHAAAPLATPAATNRARAAPSASAVPSSTAARPYKLVESVRNSS